MSSLEKLKSSSLIWTANTHAKVKQAVFPFQQAALDSALQGGISQYGLVHFQTQTGCGELTFCLPVIKAALQAGQYIALINPPGLPNSDWFNQHVCNSDYLFFIHSQHNNENLWAFEQCLTSGICGVVIAWDLNGNSQQLRRCHLRATQHHCQAIWFNKPQTAGYITQTPCSAQLRFYSKDRHWYVDIIKQQGGWPKAGIQVKNPMPLDNSAINHALHSPALDSVHSTCG